MTTTPLGDADPPQHHGDWKPAFDQLRAENEVLEKQVRSYAQLHELARVMALAAGEMGYRPGDPLAEATRAWLEADAALSTGGIDI